MSTSLTPARSGVPAPTTNTAASAVSTSAEPLVNTTTRTLYRWVRKYADVLAEETEDDGWRDLSAHDARRTWATLLAGAEGVDPLLVCDWGGWSDLQTFLDHYRGTYSPEVQREARDSVSWL